MEATASRRWWQLPNLWLLVCLTSFFIVYPLITRTGFGGRFLDLILSGSVILILYSQSNLPRKFRLAFLTMGALTIVSGWLPQGIPHLNTGSPVLYSLFFTTSFVMYCHRVIEVKTVDVDTLLAASCAYILLGFLFATTYIAIWQANPDSFHLSEVDGEYFHELIYFSFVTLTTLGYGDVTPQTPSTQLLAALEAILGQIFVTMVVASLVGIHVAQNQTRIDQTTED